MQQKFIRLLYIFIIIPFYITQSYGFDLVQKDREVTLIIIPAREKMIEIAFAISALHKTDILTCRQNKDTEEPVLYLWTGSAWEYIDIDSFCNKDFTADNIGKTIFIGRAASIPPELRECVTWSQYTEEITTFNTAAILNQLDNTYHFSEAQWKRLSKQFRLKLLDLNAEKRSYNPYDIKRSQLPLKLDKLNDSKDKIPPAVILEEDEMSVTEEQQTEETKEPVSNIDIQENIRTNITANTNTPEIDTDK
jgi:hypothetical protein